MKWVKASERLPDVLPDTSEQFFIRMIDDGRKKVSFYGISSHSLLRKSPWNVEWLDETESPSPSIEELAEKVRKANPFTSCTLDREERKQFNAWNNCVTKLIELSKQQTND